MLLPEDYVVWLRRLDLEDRKEVGDEFASLGELAQHTVSVVPTIIVTPQAFIEFQKANNLQIQIGHLLGTLNFDRHDSVMQVGTYLQKIINHGQIPRSIYEKVFHMYDKEKLKRVSLEAYYFRDNKMISRQMWTGITGEAVLIEKMRNAWSHLFSTENLTIHDIHHKNHHTFFVCLAIRPSSQYELTGTVKTSTKFNGEHEIRVHSDHNLLSKDEITTLIDYANVAKRHLIHPQVLHFGRVHDKLYITTVLPVSDEIRYDGNEYKSLMKGLSVHPGITIGKLKLINKNQRPINVGIDEIVYVEEVDKDLIMALKKAKGLIFSDDISPDIKFLLKSFGIPTITHGKHVAQSFVQGDIVSLNATTGEVKRGSMLV